MPKWFFGILEKKYMLLKFYDKNGFQNKFDKNIEMYFFKTT